MEESDLTHLQKVVEETALFPAEMLPEMYHESFGGEKPPLWMTLVVDGTPVAMSYSVQEAFAEGTWNMLALAVSPALQGQGLGSALVRAIERELLQRGQRILIVDTSGTDDFALTRKFYRSIGYTLEARIRDFWADGDDKVTFRKRLG